MKQCKLCGEWKEKTEFYKKKDSKDGLFTKCKDCIKKEQKKRYNTPEYREWNRKRTQSKEYKESMKEYFKDYDKKRNRKESVYTSEKRNARVKLCTALEGGHINRPDYCEECGDKCIPQGHHEDYSRPLDVIWLCQSCHMKRHRKD